MKDSVAFAVSVICAAGLACLAMIMLVAFTGCGTGGKEDDTQSSSESTVDIVDCSGATFEAVPLEEVEAIVEAAEDGDEIIIEEQPRLDQDAALRLFKVTVISGCGNTVINEDNDVVSDDDVSTVVDAGDQE